MTDDTRRLVKYLGAALLCAIVTVAGSWLFFDRHLAEKIATMLVMPTGLTWCSLLVATLVAWSQRVRLLAGFLAAAFLTFWICSSTLTANWAMGSLENRYARINPADAEQFDLIIVLGGATASDLEQNVWLQDAGDRVMLAARLYHHGKVDRLLTTGQAYDWADDVDQSEATFRIWTDIGIPPEAIERIGGHNTTEEMKNIRQLLGDNPPARVGLLTSAFHLPRAERLAKAAGLKVIPIAAGFYGPLTDPFPLSVVPRYHALRQWDLVVKEYLAAAVSR